MAIIARIVIQTRAIQPILRGFSFELDSSCHYWFDQNAIQEKIEDYVSDRKHKIIFK